MQDLWNLMQGDLLLGSLILDRTDQPFHFYRFEPTEAFLGYSPLFLAELRSLNADDMVAWERDYGHIERLGLTLVAVDDSARVTDFILHVEVELAWIRF